MTLTEDDKEFMEERAGILEFEAGMTRAQAEAQAWILMVARRKRLLAALEAAPA